jgi:hypothetical protein
MRAFRSALLVLMGICVVLGYGRTRAENPEAGKSAQKLFSSNCAQCHSNPRALAPRMSNWALTGFTRGVFNCDREPELACNGATHGAQGWTSTVLGKSIARPCGASA